MITDRKYRFIDPNPSFELPSITSEPTEIERYLSEYFSPIESRPADSIAGLLIRSSVDKARYERSIKTSPEKREHYERLGRATLTMCQKRLESAFEEHGIDIIENVKDKIAKIDWTGAEYTPYIGPIKNESLSFAFNPSYDVWYENGGMKNVPMLPGEESHASFKCGGGPHAEDVVTTNIWH